MDERSQDSAASRAIRAIEANTAEFLLALGRAGGAEQRNEPHIQWVIGGSPIDYHNCVVRADLPLDMADSAIMESVKRFQARAVPGSWHVGPSMRPADIGERLIAHGFTHGGDEIGMAADLLDLREDLPIPDACVVERVRDERDLAIWTRTLALGFGEGEREAAWVGQMYRNIGLADDRPWRHYIGRLHEQAVATASMFLSAGVAGVYFVFTAPPARRQGIGAAITLAALRDARALGCRIGVLGSSAMGYSVYRRLGFREYCTLGIYEWPCA